MAETKLTGALPTLPVPPSEDVSKIIPTGLVTDPEIRKNYEEFLKTQKRYADELEARYAQPNYFKIAAGFAKPQLGGFLASLGSASEALGEQQELQRAMAPTVAKMRSEIARGNIALTQGLKAAKPIEEALGRGVLPSPVAAAEATAYTRGPAGATETGQTLAINREQNIRSNIAAAKDYADFKARLGAGYTETEIKEFFAKNPGLTPPAGTPSYLLPSTQAPAPAAGGAGAPAGPSEPAARTASAEAAQAREQIPGVDVKSLTQQQYLDALKKYNAQKQERLSELTKEVSTQGTAGKRVYEVSQQIHDLASSPLLTNIFAQFEKGDLSGTIGKMMESQGLSSMIANIREIAQKRKLGGRQALTQLNNLETLMAELQTQMQNAVINPTNERTRSEVASMPNLRNSQDAFVRMIRYIANEGLNKYENSIGLQQAQTQPKFDPNFWLNDKTLQDITRRATQRREAIMRSPATQDRPIFMRGSIDQSAYKGPTQVEQGQAQAQGQAQGPAQAAPARRRLTAKELRELAGKQD